MYNTAIYDASYAALASNFKCGNVAIDRFLRDDASRDKSYGKTYVWLSDDKNVIIGYYNIGVGYIEQCIDNKYQKIGGSAHINYFALDERFHRRFVRRADNPADKVYIADILLDDCIRRIEEIRDNFIGFSFITLCSTERGHHFYLRNDFYDLEEDMSFSPNESEENCHLMYFPLDYE